MKNLQSNVIQIRAQKPEKGNADVPNKEHPYLDPKRPLEGLASTIIATAAAGIIISLLGWVGFSISSGAEAIARMQATAKHVEKSQDEIKGKIEKTHESIIVMSATHATRDELTKQKQMLLERINELDIRLRAIENSK